MITFEDYQDAYANIAMQREGGILELRLHTDGGPFQVDAMTAEQFAEAFRAIAQDQSNHVIILTGTGDEFSGPIPDPKAPTPFNTAVAHEPYHAWGVEVIDALLSVQAPVIAAINGPARRRIELALLSDIVLCTEDTEFQDTAHIARGRTPGDGISVITALSMGLTRSRYFHLTCQVISAEQALEWGLVNEVLPRGAALDRAWELARTLNQQKPMVLRHTRLLFTHELRRRMHDTVAYGLSMEGLEAVAD